MSLVTRSKKRFIFLILASERPENVMDENSQRSTWFKNISADSLVIWLRGKPGIKPHVLAHTLWVDCEDSKILEKTVKGITYLQDIYSFDYLIRTNVSTYFFVSSFTEKLSQISDKNFIAGYPEISGKTNESFSRETFISGAAICIPEYTTRLLLEIDLNLYSNWPDDVAISNHLNKAGSRFIAIKRSNLGYHHLVLLNPYIRCKSSTKSKLASARISYLYGIESANSWSKMLIRLLELQAFEIRHCTYNTCHLINYLYRLRNCLKTYLKIVIRYRF